MADGQLALSVPRAPSRRRMLAALGLAALLAGCASRSAPRASASGPGAARRAPPTAAPPSATPLLLNPGLREEAVARAMLLVNTPYSYGGNTPEGGFDCSGLVHYVLTSAATDARATRRLPRSTAQWAAVSTPVDESRLQRGDLVFFNTSGAAFSHMGIYVGESQFVHAPSSGGTVRKDRVDSRYFGPRYLGARSVFSA